MYTQINFFLLFLCNIYAGSIKLAMSKPAVSADYAVSARAYTHMVSDILICT